MKSLWKRLINDSTGQDLIEYALLAGLISLIALVAITAIGGGVNGVYTNINTQIQTIPGAGS
jgi:pilus assembly protein Flp/PilA